MQKIENGQDDKVIQRPDELAIIWFGQWSDDGSMSPAGLSYLNIAEVRSAATTVTGLAGVQEQSATLVIGERVPDLIQTGMVTANFFQVMGVPITSGRDFRAEDDVPPVGAPVMGVPWLQLVVAGSKIWVRAVGRPPAT